MVLAKGRRDNIRREVIVDSILSLWGREEMDVERVNSAGGRIKTCLSWMIRYHGACRVRLNLARTLQAAIDMVPFAAGGGEWEPRPRRFATDDAAVAGEEQWPGPHRFGLDALGGQHPPFWPFPGTFEVR